MTVTEINTVARQRYNAVNDTFWSDSEISSYIYKACLEMSREGFPIERSYTQSSVASQQDYDLPTYAVAVKRVTYNGAKLVPINMREDDGLTLNNSATTQTGTPTYYFVWNRVLSLRPIPSASSVTIKVWTLNEPQAVSTTSTLEIPTQFHMGLMDSINMDMAAKDQNYKAAQWYQANWEKTKSEVRKWVRSTKRRDAFGNVQDEETLGQLLIGTI